MLKLEICKISKNYDYGGCTVFSTKRGLFEYAYVGQQVIEERSFLPP